MGEQFTITLPDELAKFVREQVKGGAYASVDDLVKDALCGALPWSADDTVDTDIEEWLHTVVKPRLDELDADPSLVMTPDEVRAMIDEEAKRLGISR